MPITGIGHYSDAGRRTVRLNSGGTVSRTTAENMFAQKWGFANNKALRRAQQSSEYKAAKNKPGYQRGMQPGVNRTEYNAAAANYYSDPANRSDNSPDGPKAKLLEAMGRRNPSWDYNVGESPTVV